LLERVKDDPDTETEEMAKVLYEAALINSGFFLIFFLCYRLYDQGYN